MSMTDPAWQDIENHMVEIDDEPFPTPPENDGEQQRQRDADFRAEVRRIQDVVKKARQNPFFKKQAD